MIHCKLSKRSTRLDQAGLCMVMLSMILDFCLLLLVVGFLHVKRKCNRLAHSLARRLRLVGVKIGGTEKEERKIGEKMMFSLVWFKRENTKDEKYSGKKIHPGPQIFILPIWEENWEDKSKKGSLALELHIYPLQVDVLYVSFFPFLFYFILFFILLWELACL